MIKYRVERGVVVLPRHLCPGGANMRVAQGDIFELGDVKDRFLRRSLANGDISLVVEETKKGSSK